MSGNLSRRFRGGRSPFDDIVHIEEDGTEWWSAREMMEPLGYAQWRSMENVIERAESACRNSGHRVEEHFARARKMFSLPNGAERTSYDVQMTRFGCYLLAMNGDPTKPEIAAAQQYFTVMTRAAEKAIAVPAAIIQAPRPWSERFRQTIEPHVRFMYMNHPGCFTVVSTLVGQMLSMEDELIRHMFELRASDRPDVSIGRRWSEDRKARGLAPADRYAPLLLPDQDREVLLRVYEDSERGTFEAWFGRVYLPFGLPDYYGKKPEFVVHGNLPPASAADHTCRRLTGSPASLAPHLRRQLTAIGDFCPVGVKPPAIGGRQQTMFD